MKTGKKFLCILLILVMAVFLFTGCGKKKTEKDTTLEGTWRVTKMVEINDYYEYDGSGNVLREEKGEEEVEEYPLEKNDEEIGLNMILQPYIQFKNGKATTYAYTKLEVPSEYNDLFNKLIKLYPIMEMFRDGVVIKDEENGYSATEKYIVITRIRYDEDTDEEYEEEDKYSYVIDGKKMTMTAEFVDEYEDEDILCVDVLKQTLYLEKVKDSVVDNAIDIDEYELPSDF
ncbi:MAG TPA: hypothetical protein GXZ97_00980 [Hydrogenispora sp.]|nr:hypothetical protein [Hydrogenispora sp.]